MINEIVIEKKTNNFTVTIIDKLYFFFILSAFISTLSAKSVLGSLNWIFYSLTTGYLVYKIVSTLELEKVQNVLRYLVFFSSICAIYGMYEYTMKRSIIFGEFWGRLTSLLGHPLLNGIIFSTIFPFSLALLFKTEKKRYIFSSALIFIAIILTFARGSWIALSCGLLVFILFAPTKIRLKILFSLLIISLLLIFLPVLSQPIKDRLNKNENRMYSSFDIRIKSIPIALKIIKDKPFFGGGPFNAIRYKDIYETNLTLRKISFENSYLELLIDLGIIGFSILLMIFLLVLYKTFISLRIKDDFIIYRIAGFASFIIFLINIATFNFDTYRTFHFVTWFFIGLNICLIKHSLNDIKVS